MKRSIIIILVLAAVLLLSSCSTFIKPDDDGLLADIKNAIEEENEKLENEAEEIEEILDEAEEKAEEEAELAEEQNESKADMPALDNEYAAMMQGGAYYMEYTSYVMGMEMECKQAQNGMNSDTISDFGGMKTRTMTLDGYQYDIDDDAKKYSKTQIADDMAALSGVYDYSGLKYDGSGEDTIPDFSDVDSAAYPYEQYSVDIKSAGGEMTVVIRYYMKDGELYVISTDAAGMSVNMVIKTMTTDIPAGMLEVPSGYEEVDSLY